MKIIVGKFKIQHCEKSLNSYDILESRINKKGVKVFDELAFGVSIERAIEIIITKTLNEEVGDVNLNEFIVEYKRVAKNVLDELGKI